IAQLLFTGGWRQCPPPAFTHVTAPARVFIETSTEGSTHMSRIAIFIYGLIAYAVFFVTFLYLFGFAGGFFVPKSVHSGEASGPIWLAAMINLGLIGLFGAQHAVMARPGFKQWWTAIIPPAMER